MTNSLWVTLHNLWKAISSHLFLWPTACEWHCTFCERQSHHIFSYDQQGVSDISHSVKCRSFLMNNSLWVTLHIHMVKNSLITPFPMTNREWVTLHNLWKAVSSPLFLWPTVCEWHCIFCERQSHHIFPITNRKWVTLHILWKTVSSHLFLSPTAGEWHCTFCEKAVSSHLFLWPTVCKWPCTFCEKQSHHIFSYDQQRVSDIAHFVKGSLITSFPMTNSLWVTLHILWRESHHIFSYDQQGVGDIAHFVKGSLITSFPITILSLTACEWSIGCLTLIS